MGVAERVRCEAWDCFAETEPAEDSARAWVTGATWAARTGGLDEGVMAFFLSDAPMRLRDLGVWDASRAQLEAALTPNILPAHLDEQQISYCAALFAAASLSPEVWRQKIDQWSEGPNLPWKTLLMAGAPHDSIARWCLGKLRQKDLEDIKVDGPLGVLATGGQILKTEGWELAYDEARNALEWLLDQGDESAVLVFADACFAEDNDKQINPIVRKLETLQMSVPLSQDLWGRVIGRSGGRAALYRRVECGEGLGNDGHFMPGKWLSTDAELWEQLVHEVGLRDTLNRAPTEDEATEARRLFAAFEQWMAALPAVASFYRLTPERTSWADPALRPAKTLMVMCGAIYGLDVTGRLHTLLRSIVDDAQPREEVLLKLLGVTLAHVCAQQKDPPEALLMLAAKPEVAARINSDETKALWGALLQRLGIDEVMQLVDAMAISDLGLGFFDALAETLPAALERYQGRPDLLRAVLVRSSEGRFTPSLAFHMQAWEHARRPEEICDLDRLPAGDWLAGLIQQSRRWATPEREGLLRWLAQRSHHVEVRRGCLEALLEEVV